MTRRGQRLDCQRFRRTSPRETDAVRRTYPIRPPARAVSQVTAFQLVMQRWPTSCQGQRPTRICPPTSVTSRPASPRRSSDSRAEARPGDERGGRADLRDPAAYLAATVTCAEPARGGLPGVRVDEMVSREVSLPPAAPGRPGGSERAADERHDRTFGIASDEHVPRPPAGRQAEDGEVAAGAHERGLDPEAPEQLERCVDGHALRDPAQVEAALRGQR